MNEFHSKLVKNAILWGISEQETRTLLQEHGCVFEDEAIRIGAMLAAKEKENQAWNCYEAI